MLRGKVHISILRTGTAFRHAIRALLAGICLIAPITARAQPGDTANGKLPYRQQPIDYFGPVSDDVVARLQTRLERQEVRLEFREPGGYLLSLLDALDVPDSSQMLVFAKNSVNARLISPENPRALYFSDEVYVGWVPGSPALEISAVDPRKGALFYTLRQEPDKPPQFVREESCLLCHAAVNSLHVPGHLARSFLTDSQGNPSRGISRITQDTPLARRWGGWYVTGDFGNLSHQGNLATEVALQEYERIPDGPGRKIDLKSQFDAAKYPASHSDIVALLVHDHQLHAHNLLTRVNYEERLRAGVDDAASQAAAGNPQPVTDTEEQLVRYLLFVDAAPLDNAVLGKSAFEAWFSKQGPRDRQGRSLRQFELETRLFRYRLSYLIYSRAFDALPSRAKERVCRRLWDILKAAAPPEPFDRLPLGERQAIVEILRDTKPGLPTYWK